MSIQGDLHNNVDYAIGLVTEAITDTTAQVSAIFDMRSYCSLEYIISIGTLADVDATFAVTIQHGDDSALSDGVAVPAAQLLGTLAEASFQFDDDDSTKKLGYIGDKRYVEMTITPVANTGAATFAMTTAAVPLHRGTLN